MKRGMGIWMNMGHDSPWQNTEGYCPQSHGRFLFRVEGIINMLNVNHDMAGSLLSTTGKSNTLSMVSSTFMCSICSICSGNMQGSLQHLR